ncbi:DUF3558 domain-containing protein [Corynebacterium mastitidis]|uniref:DUF3558 domain-containing protein n=1 Tax=Corynebacterium mastitidis TaxID=161890 RepID=A0A2N0X8B4_9CORY|nr:DUF3558 family protein [Corynebacterium mastitidis]MCH6196808.1 DUF3558 domain-containing protein [Corynebacterium mastitidis]PKF68934.1 hypothetical protein CXB45_04295 [Corynebacterium mastitidis]
MSVRLSTRVLIPLWAVLLAGAAACSSTDTGIIAHDAVGASGVETVGSAAGSAAREEKRGGGENESGGLPFEVGPWDASDPNFRFFDPCAEIPAEIFAEVGLGEMEGEPLSVEGSYSNCHFFVPLEGGKYSGHSVGIFADLIPEEKYESVGLRLIEDADNRGISLAEEQDRHGETCSSVMFTDRGRWGLEVSYGGLDASRNNCLVAKEIHENIIELIRG